MSRHPKPAGKIPYCFPDSKIEVHIFDFDRVIYSKIIRINFLKYLRDEKKFDDLKELTSALDQDKQNCMTLIEEINLIRCNVAKK